MKLFKLFENKMDAFYLHFFENEDVAFYMKEKKLTTLQIKHHYKELFPKFQAFKESPSIKKYFALKELCFAKNDYGHDEPNIFFFYMLQYGSLFYQKRNLPESEMLFDEKTFHIQPTNLILKSNYQSMIELIVITNMILNILPFNLLLYIAQKEDFQMLFSQKSTIITLFNKMDEQLKKEDKIEYFNQFFAKTYPKGIDETYLDELSNLFQTAKDYQAHLIEKEKSYLESICPATVSSTINLSSKEEEKNTKKKQKI